VTKETTDSWRGGVGGVDVTLTGTCEWV